MTARPSTNGANGHDAGGRFTKGNRGGPGNPHARHVARLRAALLRAVKPKDLEAVVKALVERAKQGDVAAIRELLDRLLGKSVAPVEIAGEVNGSIIRVEVDPDFYGNAARIEETSRELLRDNEYLEWCRAKAAGME